VGRNGNERSELKPIRESAVAHERSSPKVNGTYLTQPGDFGVTVVNSAGDLIVKYLIQSSETFLRAQATEECDTYKISGRPVSRRLDRLDAACSSELVNVVNVVYVVYVKRGI
jgi:hypothetical protein